MHVRIRKRGSSASVRIPASVMAAAALHIDQTVDVRNDGGWIIIEPMAAPRYALEELLAGMSLDNFPELVNFGPEAGDETS